MKWTLKMHRLSFHLSNKIGDRQRDREKEEEGGREGEGLTDAAPVDKERRQRKCKKTTKCTILSAATSVLSRLRDKSKILTTFP